ncbi:hypothetical protein [Halarchaeum salinum]|uniref:hypothetical protein n=1 Tax=Halarchaeum salinum TaxID=489912 RepID=UPI001B86798B
MSGIMVSVNLEESVERGVFVESLAAVTTAREEGFLDTPEVRAHHDCAITATIATTRRRDMVELLSTAFRTRITHASPVLPFDASEFAFVTALVDDLYWGVH